MTDVPWVRLLGRVAADRGQGECVPTSPAMQLLLVLLASAPRDRSLPMLWRPTSTEGAGPRNPEATLHARMIRLRDWLEIPRDKLTAISGSYTLHLDPERVAFCRFHRLAGLALSAEALAAADGDAPHLRRTALARCLEPAPRPPPGARERPPPACRRGAGPGPPRARAPA